MKTNLTKIMTELYEIDPSLKEVKDLEKIVSKIISSRPNIKIDPEFVSSLRSQLSTYEPKQKFNLSWLRSGVFALGGALTVTVIVIGLYSNGTINLTQPITSSKFSVVSGEDRAFGSISIQPQEISARPMGGGGGGLGAAESADTKMIAPGEPFPAPGPIKRFVYKYNGALDLSGIENPVYQRIVNNDLSAKLASNLKADLGFMDLKKIVSGSVSSFQISENVKEGYQLYVDLVNGMVSISQNWPYWPQDTVARQATLNDIPSDDVLVSAAEELMKKFEIDLSRYDKPFVNKDWMRGYNIASSRGEIVYVPNEVAVTYPLLIEDGQIREQWGGVYGLTVSVNVFTKKATSAYNIFSQNYRTSKYELVKDDQLVRQTLAKGGFDSLGYWEGVQFQDVEVSLGEPRVGYMHHSQWRDNANQELFVPALIFPIISIPEGEELYKNEVVIPLVKEIFDNASNPIIMPFIR